MPDRQQELRKCDLSSVERGRDSVEAFLAYGRLKGLRELNDDRYFGLATIITNFFGNDGFNVYSESAANALAISEEAMFVDNGPHIVDRRTTVDRICPSEVEQQEYAMDKILLIIDQTQPAASRCLTSIGTATVTQRAT